MVSKHAKPSAENPQGGIVKKEASIHISNLGLIENGCYCKSRIQNGRRQES